jgi:pyridoxal phosphate enzyme (YggS family)
MTIETNVSQGLLQVRQELEAACHACRRAPSSVSLLAVSKQQSAAAISTIAALGQREFGESYVQEALDKMVELQDLTLRWHFIGQLQSNKTRAIAEHFDWVHTLDRDKIATRLHEQRPPQLAPLQVCIQVKLAEEAGKGGVWPDEVVALAAHIQQLSRLKLRGLMCIPPPTEDFAEQLTQFQRLAALQQELHSHGLPLDTLSMGMSGDFAAAIAAGATIVRIGTAVFGARQ